jgi:broad specificity phosphatase PhoE
MNLLMRTPVITRVLLVRPGSTEFDEQGRFKGSLDMPLSSLGEQQAEAVATELAETSVGTIYSAPCESAQQTAMRLARGRDLRVKVLECFQNIDHGLWHGKLIDEVRRNHPRVYRTGLETPDEICPPGGESIRQARVRVAKALRKVMKKGRENMVALVVPDPLATVVQSVISGEELYDLWNFETDRCDWQILEATL